MINQTESYFGSPDRKKSVIKSMVILDQWLLGTERD